MTPAIPNLAMRRGPVSAQSQRRAVRLGGAAGRAARMRAKPRGVGRGASPHPRPPERGCRRGHRRAAGGRGRAGQFVNPKAVTATGAVDPVLLGFSRPAAQAEAPGFDLLACVSIRRPRRAPPQWAHPMGDCGTIVSANRAPNRRICPRQLPV
jgi:hypothetical protein